MPIWRLTYRPTASPPSPLITDVVAEVHEEHQRHHVFFADVPVMDRPRRFIVLRVDKRDLAGRPFRLCDVTVRWGGVRLGPAGVDRRG